ncbi:hypothetical protein [Pseudovibrio sp. Ad26]|uniref:hypothetical protein n=1 Tax=Pseudovibrio sp. Ad26 TaxID=989410 RepID=UPI0007AE6D0D|nr:hypothetical protein [Pseudovibrio sp. Ad26]KZL16284.1 hypothetical protein PsAD26_00322 [Pseudovibrio sp. Ad26]
MSDTGREISNVDMANESKIPSAQSINLGNNQELDLSGLSEAQIAELKMQHASGRLSLMDKATEMKADVGALDATLASFTEQTAKATDTGSSATITHSQTSSIGRTEIVIGNTDKAASGKLSRSAKGEEDRTVLIVGIIAVAVIVVAFLAWG